MAVQDGISLGDFSISWLKAKSKVPFPMWHRPSRTIASKTLPKTRMISLTAFYSTSLKVSKIKTQMFVNRRCPQSVSFRN